MLASALAWSRVSTFLRQPQTKNNHTDSVIILPKTGVVAQKKGSRSLETLATHWLGKRDCSRLRHSALRAQSSSRSTVLRTLRVLVEPRCSLQVRISSQKKTRFRGPFCGWGRGIARGYATRPYGPSRAHARLSCARFACLSNPGVLFRSASPAKKRPAFAGLFVAGEEGLLAATPLGPTGPVELTLDCPAHASRACRTPVFSSGPHLQPKKDPLSRAFLWLGKRDSNPH